MDPTTQLVVQSTISILTIVCSGVVSAIVTHKLNAQKARQDLLREKLEELFMAVQGFGSSFVLNMGQLLAVMTNQLAREKAFENLNKNAPRDDFEKCEMLVALYFPEIQSTYSEWDKFRKIAGEFALPLDADNADTLRDSLLVFCHQQKVLEAALAAIAHDLSKPRPLLRLPWPKRRKQINAS